MRLQFARTPTWHAKRTFGTAVQLVVACLLLVNPLWAQETTSFDAHELAKSVSGSPEKSLPPGWSASADENHIRIRSPLLKLNPSRDTGLPPGQVTRRFSFAITVHPRMSDEARAARVKRNAELGEQLPDSKIVPEELEPIARQIKPVPDFYDREAAYEMHEPGYLPARAADWEEIVSVYELLRTRWRAYPNSGHDDKGYFPKLLREEVDDAR